MTILGIESSCDETAAALVEYRKGSIRVLKALDATQIAVHGQFGGVVPEVAARNHMEHVLPLIQKTLGAKKPDMIAATTGPGLITSLLVGAQTARALSYVWNVPLVAVNHIEGHLYANFVGETSNLKPQTSNLFPALVLIVSGGHTELVLMKGHGKYMLLGATRDDAAGEAFDKGARLLGLSYPGGPEIAKAALSGDRCAYAFPRPMLASGNYEFRFSGLKTSLLYTVATIKKSGKKLTKKIVADLSASYQHAIVDVLCTKTLRAAREYSVKTVLCGGGVIANKELRERLQTQLAAENIRLCVPSQKLCTDNAIMIAAAACFKVSRKEFTSWKKIDVKSQWDFTQSKK